jgi:DNA-directed RNA polymerase subunit RPC12/RpoP
MENEVVREVVQCNRCGYKWIPSSKNPIPKRCAKCNNPYWNKPRIRPLQDYTGIKK